VKRRRGTTIAGSVSRSHDWGRRAGTMSPRILGHGGTKRRMLDIVVELLMCHHLNHILNVWTKSTRSSRVGGDVPNLINNILKNIKVHELHESIQQVSLIGWYSFGISNSWC
jgi:hypothetical protein